MKNITGLSFARKRVLIRVDFNVPLDENFKITDDSRIVATLPTIKKVIADGGKAIIISHLGRPKYGFEEKFSLKHIVQHLSFLLDRDVAFSSDCIGENTANDVAKLQNKELSKICFFGTSFCSPNRSLCKENESNGFVR